MKISDAILNFFNQNFSSNHIFGIPGGYNGNFVDTLNERSDFQFISTKHETGAVFMADGYYRVSRKPAIVTTTAGPGATNAITGIASAFADSIPIFLLTGYIPTENWGKGAIQESTYNALNTVEMFKEVTGYSNLVLNKNHFSKVFNQAIKSMLLLRKKPVHVAIPADLISKTIDEKEISKINISTYNRNIDPFGIENLADVILKKKMPLILSGYGVTLSQAYNELEFLSRTYNIPVITTPKGKSSFNESLETSLGVFGIGGHNWSTKFIEEVDVDLLLILGSSLNEWSSNAWRKELFKIREVFQVDIEPLSIGKVIQSSKGIIGDIKVVLKHLNLEIQKKIANNPGIWDDIEKRKRKLSEFKKKHKKFEKPPEKYPLTSYDVLNFINEFFNDDINLFVDNGNSIGWAVHYYEPRKCGTFHISLGFASMGYATGAVIGGKISSPEKTSIALVGDGAMLMFGNEVSTAVQYRVPAMWFVLNNGSLGLVEVGSKLVWGRANPGVSFKRIDFEALSRSMGAVGIKIKKREELNLEFANRLKSLNQPVVVDFHISPEEIPPLGGRIESIKKTA